MNKAELILRELEKGNFNVLSELEIIKRATTRNPEYLDALYRVYGVLGKISTGSLNIEQPSAELKVGDLVEVDMPEIYAYKRAADELTMFLDTAEPGDVETLDELKNKKATAWEAIDSLKLPHQRKQCNIVSISGDNVILQGIPEISWRLNQLKKV